MDRTALVPLGNQVVVIGLDGQLRVLAEGQQPLPGEVIVAMTDAAPQDLKIQLAQEQGLKDISDDVAQIISAIEQGQDPSAIDEELAPAAGENSGSSLQNSATIVRDGTEVLASTNFETIGLESLGLSETQALTLNDFFTTGIETSGDGSSKPLTNSPVTLSAVEEDSDPITITTEELLSNVNIDDADTLVITNVTIESGNGTLIDNSDGSWTYIPEADDDTEVSFSYDIIDDDGGVINGTANLDITPVNDAPIATNDAIQTDEDSLVVIDVLANDSDIEGDDLIITSASVPEEQGIVEIIDGKLVFTPAENFNGNATISYTISDGELEDEAQVSVTVNSVNDAPIASNDTTITEEDSSVTIDVLPNDTDIDGDTLSIQSASVPETQGTVEIVDGKLVFTPAENFHGDAEITYTVTDGALTDQATVNVTVNAVNDTPVVESNIADQTLAEDFTPYTIDLNTAFSDVDNVDGELSFSVSGNSNIQVAIVNGIATFTPTADWNGSEALTFTATDPSGESVSQTVNFTVAPVADIVADNATVVEDTPTIIKVLGNDTFEGDDKVVSLDTNNGPANGTVSVNPDGSVTYTPNDNYHGTDSFTYIVTSGGVSESTTVNVDVTPVNDAPVAKDDTAVTDEDTPVTIDVLPNDTDIDGDKLSIQSASVPETQGTVEIVDGKLVFTPAENFHGDAEITYTVTDGALTDQATVNVTVNAVNDTPVVESNIADQTLAEDFTPYSIDLNTAFSDVDNADGELTFSVSGNSNIQVAIVNGIATFTPTADWNGSEALTFTATDPSGESVSQTVNFTVAPVADIVADNATVVEDTPTIIKVLGNDTFEGDDKVVSLDTNNGPANGTVSVNPDGSVTYTPNDNYHGTDSFTYIVTSGGVSESTTVNVDVTPVNDAPVAKDDTAVTDEDTPVTIDVLPNDTDIDGDTLSIQSASVPETQGTVEIVDGKLVFTPAENFNGDVEITYTVTDGSLTDQATVNVTVNAVNDTPVVESNIADQTLAEDFTPYSIDLNTAFSDVDNVDGELSFSVSGNSNIQVAIVNGIATFTPTADWNGSEALTFTATDPSGESVSQTVNFTVAPVADIVADNATVVEDTPTIIKVLGNDTFEGDDKVVSLDTNNGPANGTVSVNPDGSVTYTPNDNYHGTDSFTYIVTSGGVSESTTVNVDVTPVNDAPVATNDNAVTDEDTPVTIDVLPNDTDIDGDTLSIQSASVPEAQGTVEIVDGKLVFTPAENFNGDAEITYTITDGALTDQATVNVTVNAVNDAPVVESSIADQALAEDFTPYSIDLNTAFSDVDNVDGDLSFSVSGNSNIQVAIVNGIATFTPTADWNGSEALTFTATDPSGESVSQTVNFTVAPVADIVADNATVVEDTPTIIKVLGNDTFEGDDKVVSLDTNNGPANGTVSVNLVGSVTYTPNDNYHGTDSFTYIVTSGGVSESTTVNVDVTPVNDAPVATNDNAVTDEDTPVTIDVLPNDTDIDGDTLSIQSASVPETQGTVEIVDGKLVFTPAENFHGDAEITYTVTDGALTDQATVNVTVNAVNDTPVVESNIADQTLAEDFTPYTIDLNTAFSDVDNVDGELSFSVSGNSNIQVAIVNGIATFTPTADWNGSEALTFTATDPSGESVSQTVNFTVAPVADIVADNATVVEDTPTIIKVLGNDTFEGDDKVVSLDTNNGPANGTVSVNPDGSVTYTPNDNYHGTDSFTYIVTSGGVSESTTVNVDVTPVNDAPVAKDDTAVTDEDTPVTIDVLPNDTDIDGDKLSIQSASVPEAQGTVEIVDGKLVFTPAENFHGDAEITYTITDGSLTDQAKVAVTVNPVNDAPTIKVDAVESITEDAVSTDTVVATLEVADTDTPEEQLTVSLENNSNGYFALVGDEVKLTQAGVDAVNNDELNLKDLTISASASDGVNPTVSDSDSLIVNRVNDAPTVDNVISDQVLAEDFTIYTIDLNDAFKDSDSALNFSVSGNSNVLVSIENGIATISPTADWNGSEALTFTATDPSGESVSQTVNFTVAPVADIVADKATVVEDTPTIINVLGNDTFEGSDKVVSLDTNHGPANGTVSVNPDGSVTYTPNDNYHGADSFTYIVTSGGVSESTTVNIDVTPVNDAPVATNDNAVTDEDTPVTIDVLPNDTDVDGDKLSIESASVPETQGTVEIVDGKLVFTPAENFHGDAEITYTVTDGALTDQATVNVTVNAVNDTPVVESSIADQTLAEDFTPYSIDLNTAFSDVDNVDGDLTFSVSGNSNIQVAIVNGIATFTPTADWNGSETLTFTATDPSGESVSQTVNFTVAPVADIVADNATVVEDTPTIIKVLGNDTFEGDDKVVSLDTNNGPANGTVSVNPDGSVTYTPNDNYHGADSFTYIVTSGGVSESTTVNVDVTPVNDAPVANDDAATTQEDTAVTIDILPNDTDIDGDTLRIDSASVPSDQGTVEIVDGKLVFTPAENFHGDAEITYTITDGSLTDQATVNVTVNAVNDTPVVESSIADQTLAEDFTPYSINLNTAFSDVDNADGELTFSVSGNSNVNVSIENGIATISPTADWNGSEALTFTATDPSGESVSQTVNFMVAPVADIESDRATVVEDTPTIINVLGNDTFEGDDKVVSLDSNNGPANGTVSVNPDGSVTYTPNDNFHGTDSFTYIVTSGGVSEFTTVNVDVTPVNDAPVAKDDTAVTDEDTPVTIDVLPNDTDIDGDKLSIQSASVPSEQGTVEIVDGKLVFTPAENFHGDAEITYTITDGALTDQATVTVTVNAVNDTPVVESNIADQTLAEDFTPYTIDLNTAFSDVDNADGELTFSVSGNSNIQVAIVNGIVTFTPTADWNGSEILTFTATDPSGESVSQTVNFTVAPVADIVADKATVVEDTATIIKVLDNDTFEGDDKVVSLDTNNGPANGTVSVNPDGSVTYTPNDNYHGTDSFTYIVTSGGVSESTTVSVDVTPVNDAPVAKDDTAITDEDTPVTIDVLPNDTDIDGEKLSIESASVPKEQGTVEVVDGKLVFTPAENFNGDAEITYIVTDGELTDEAKVTVTVNPVNDAPTIKVDAVESITEDAVNTDTVVATLTVRDTDTPEDQLTVSLENNSNGYFVLVGDEVKLTQAGVDAVNNDELNLKDLTISASVSDGVNPTANDSDSLIVNRVNDAPTVDNVISDQVLSEDFDAYTIDLNEVFKDSDSSLEFSVSGNNNIQISIVNGVATITPTADWNGKETITFTAKDPSGESVSQTVNFTVAPVADIEADSADVVEDTPTIINVLGNDTFDGDDKVVSLDTNKGPANGTVSVNPDGAVTYIPDDNYVGKDTFTYVVTSGGVSESTTVEVNVTPVNDAPVAKDDTAITDEDTPVTIDVLPNDTDVDGDKLSIQSASVPEAQGKVEIVDGKLVFTPAENFNGDTEITYTITDGALTDQATVNVTVNAVNDTPAVESNLADQTLAEDFTPYTIDLNTAFSDVDNVDGELTFSVSGNSNVNVSIENGIATISPTADWNGSEILTFTATDPSGESVSQTVNFTVAPVADIEADKATVVEDTPTIIKVLGNDTFEGDDKVVSLDTNNGPANGTVSVNPDGSVTYTPNDNYHGADSFTYIVTSGGVSESTTVNVDVTPVNDAPVATNDNAVTDEDTPVTIDVLPNDTDVDGDTLSIQSASVPETQGTVEIIDGKLVFTPAENFHGDAEITYTVTDGALTDQATVNVTVNAVNDTPVVESNIADQTLAEDFTPYSIDLNTAFSDVDNVDGELTFSVSGNSNIQVAIVNGIATITPTADWNGSEALTFTATDPSGESVSQTVNFTVAPVADIVADKATVVEDTPTIIKVLGNDTFEGDDKVVSLDTNNGPANGTVSVNSDGSVTYTPNDNYHGTDSFTYIVTSGGVSESTTVNVDVTPVNDAPVATNDNAVTDEDTPVTIDVLPNDTDIDGDKLSIDSASVSSDQGTVEIVDGKLVFTPAENFNGDAEITYTVTDGTLTDQATVNVTVNAVNDTPEVESNIADQTLAEDFTPYSINLNTAFSDVDNVDGELSFSVSGNNNVLVSIENGIATISPTADWNGSEILTFTATDPSGESVSQTVNFTVTPVADIVADKATVVEDTPTIIKVLGNDTFEGDDKVVSLDTNNGPANGTVSVNSDGSVTYTPNDNYHGTDSFTYIVTSGGVSESTTVNVDVTPVNDAPVAKDDTAVTDEDTPVTIDVLPNDTDVDGDTLSIQSASVPETQGTVEIIDGKLVFTPAENFHGDAEITYTVTDGALTDQATVNVTVNAVNDTPVVESNIADQTLAEDFTPYSIDLNTAFSDVDNVDGELTFSVSGNSNIQVAIVNGIATITPTADWNGSEALTFTATDPSGESVSQTVNFTVAPVADIVADKATVVEDTPTIIKVLGNDTFEGDDKVVSLDTNNGPANGTVSVNPDGSVTYTPNDNYHGTDSFTYIVTSGGVSESTTVNVDVTPVNDAPVAKDDTAITDEDTPVTIDVLPNDTDIDGDKLSIQSASVPEAQGTVEIVDGKLVFTPAENFNGDAEITYTITDGSLTDQAKVAVTVNPVNDAPTIKVDAVESITEDAVNTDTVVATLEVVDIDTPEEQLTVSLENNSNGYFALVGDEVKLTQAGVDAVNNDELNLKDLTISASVSDGVNPTVSDSDSLIVNRVNDAPTVDNVISDQVLAEDFTIYTIDLNDAFKDSDSALNFSVSGNSNVLVSIENGIATISPTADWNGSEALTFTATDPSGESVSQTVNFTVAPVADIESDRATVVEDTPTIIKVLGNDTFEGDDKVVSLDSNNGPANGTVSVNPDGSVTYTPNDNYHGADSFTYIVTSGGVSESTIVNVDVTPVNDKPDSEDFTHVADDQLTHVVFDTDTKPLGRGDSQDHIADVEDDLKGNDLHVRITELPTSGTLFFKDSDGELHEIKEVSDTLYDKDSLYYEADNVGFLLGIKDRPDTPNSSESTTDFNNWGLSEDGGPSHSRTEHLANGASITISSDSGELAQYNRQVSHIGNGIADNDGQGIEKGETITIDLSNNPVGSVNLGLDGLGGLFDYGDDNAALITVTYLDSNNVQQTQTFEFLKPEGNFMLFQETSVGYGKDLALPEGSVITQLDFSTKNEGNWELRYVEGVPAEDSFGYVAVDSENGVSDPSTVNIVNEMLDGNIAENGPSLSVVGDSVTEGDNVTFSVVLNETTSTAVKYQVDMLAQGSSVDKNDVNLSNATYTNGVVFLGGYLIVPAGISSFEISIPTIDDLVVESSETIVLEIGGETGTATVLDNDSTKLSVVDAGDVIEGTDAIFTVLLSNPVQEAVVVNLKSTTNDSYTAEDVDLGTMVVTYVDTHGQTQTLDIAPNGDVTIPPAVAEIKVAVPTKLDNVHEGDESFGLTVTEIGSVTSNGIATGNANIVDSDPAPLVSISADQNSVNEGETAGFTLTLDKVADESVTVHVEYSGVAQDGKDFVGVLSVEVPAGQSSAALDLLTVTDGIYEGAESFTVTIKEVDGADASIASNNSASVVIVDAQSAPKVTISSDQSSVDEGSDAKFIVNIDQKADEDVLVTFTIGGNVDDKDYIAPSTYTVTIPAGKTSAPIDIKTLDDGIYEDLENLTVTLIDTVGADSTLASDSNEATVSIIDAQHAPEFISGGDSAGDKPNDDVYDFGSVNENTVSGAVIGTVVAEDHDNDVLVYRFADGSSTNGIFDIDPTSGEISLNKTIDDVDLGDYTLQVEVIDGTGGIDTAEVNVSLVNVNDAPESSPSVVEMNEDTQVMLDWSSFGISDVDSDVSDLSVQITTLPSDGSLEYRDSQGDWQSVQIDQVLDKSLFEENGVRFVPELNESGSDSFGGNQVGDQESSYAQIGFKPTDGQSSGQESTLTIDVNPVADKPNLIAVTPLNSLPQQEFNVTTWSNVQVGSSDGMGVNGETLISAINALNEADGTRLSWANVEDLGTHATLANEAVLVTSLVYLEAGSSYDFVGQADDSLAIKLGGTLLDQARWGSDSGDIKGASFTPSVSGFYPIEIYHHNQSGPGNFNVDVSINGQAPVNLSNSSLYVVSDESALEATDIRTSELQEVNGVAFYETYQLNEGLQDTAIPLSEIKASLNDTDGSESLKVTLTGLPVGAILSDGNSSITVATIDEELDVTSWALDALTVTPPAGSHDDFTINLTATSTESSNGDSAESNLAINVVVHENLPTETESDLGETIEDNTLQGNVLLNDSDGDNILMVDHLTIDGADYEVGESVSLTSGTLLVNRDGSYIFEPAEHWSGDVPLISYTTNTGVTNTLDINVVAIADPPTITINVGDLVKRDAIDPNHHLATSAINNTNTENEAVAANLGLDNAVPKINTHAGVVLGVNTDLSDTDSLFVGTDFNDVFYGGGGDDVFVGGGNNDTFYGDDATSLTLHDGKDTVYLTGNFDDYKMTFKDDHGGKVPYWILLDSRSIDSVNDHTGSDDRGDHLYEIERIVFADKIVDLKPDGTYEVLQDRWISVDVDVDLVDVDGSEDLAQTALVQDLPDGVDVYVDGVAIKQDSNGDYPVTLGTDGKLSLDIRVPFDYEGSLEFPLSVTATSVEGSNNDAASTTESVELTARDYVLESGSHGNDQITGSDDHDIIVGDVQGLEIIAGQDYNIAFVLDTSGSMGNWVGTAKQEVLDVFDELLSAVNQGEKPGTVNIHLSEFASSASAVISVDLSSLTARKEFVEELNRVIDDEGSGGTNYEAGLQSAVEWFSSQPNPNGQNITYFVTDGQPNRATYLYGVAPSEFSKVILDVDNSGKLVTLQDIASKNNYSYGQTVTYKGDVVIDSYGKVYSPLTGRILGDIDRYYGSIRYYDEGNSSTQAQHMYQVLAALSSIEAIGLGSGVDEHTLKQYDTDGVVESDIDVTKLAETILGQDVPLKQGSDTIQGGEGNDILLGDLIEFGGNEQGLSAIQSHVAQQTGQDVSTVDGEDIHEYVRNNLEEFNQTHQGDKSDNLYGGAGDDLLFGHGGNDILVGGEGDDILIGGLGSDTLTGSEGADIFKWSEVTNDVDTVTDFNKNEDALDFSDLFDDLSKDEIGELLNDLQSGDHTGDVGEYHVEVAPDGGSEANLSITKGSSTLDIHFDGASVDDVTQSLIASLEAQYKDM
ncbi:tandem-95 repeat protein [Vibrio alginolyticus]|uniref:tandem-95 repeat protein n=33 Tax=Vibrio TaxID=662 RepID=UPI00227C3613|nr:tandem-95 repeat protein [Vibrio alginolyticus]